MLMIRMNEIMLTTIMLILIGIELEMMHGLYLALIIIKLIMNIISIILTCVKVIMNVIAKSMEG